MLNIKDIISRISDLLTYKPKLPDFPTSCNLHQVDYQLAEIPIRYGHFSTLAIPFLVAKKYLYPNSNREIRSGCIAREKKRAEILVCMKCREVEDEWIELKRFDQAQKLIEILKNEDQDSFSKTMYPIKKNLDEVLSLLREVEQERQTN